MNVSFVKQICGVVIVVLVLATFWSWMLDVSAAVWMVDLWREVRAALVPGESAVW